MKVLRLFLTALFLCIYAGNTNALTIKNISVTKTPQNEIQVTFIMDRNAGFYIRKEDNHVYLNLPKGVVWQTSPYSTKTHGFINSYGIKDQDFVFSLAPHTEIESALLFEHTDNTHHYIITFKNHHWDMEKAQLKLQAAEKAEHEREEPQLVSPDVTFVSSKNTHPVEHFYIVPGPLETAFYIITRSPTAFEIAENPESPNITIRLPKTNWTELNVPQRKGGVITNTRLDQQYEDYTGLVLDLLPGTSVSGTVTLPNGPGSLPTFVIFLKGPFLSELAKCPECPKCEECRTCPPCHCTQPPIHHPAGTSHPHHSHAETVGAQAKKTSPPPHHSGPPTVGAIADHTNVDISTNVEDIPMTVSSMENVNIHQENLTVGQIDQSF